MAQSLPHSASTPRNTIERLLSGADRRSLAQVQRVVTHVLRNRARMTQLLGALDAADPLVAMRAADAVEKVSRERAEWLEPARARLLRAAIATRDPVVRWNLIQVMPRLHHSPAARRKLARRLEVWFLVDDSAIVRTSALDATVTLADADPELRHVALHMLDKARATPSAAVRARARRLTATVTRSGWTDPGSAGPRSPRR